MPMVSFYTPWKHKKPEVIWCFQGVLNKTNGMKWVQNFYYQINWVQNFSCHFATTPKILQRTPCKYLFLICLKITRRKLTEQRSIKILKNFILIALLGSLLFKRMFRNSYRFPKNVKNKIETNNYRIALAMLWVISS